MGEEDAVSWLYLLRRIFTINFLIGAISCRAWASAIVSTCLKSSLWQGQCCTKGRWDIMSIIYPPKSRITFKTLRSTGKGIPSNNRRCNWRKGSREFAIGVSKFRFFFCVEIMYASVTDRLKVVCHVLYDGNKAFCSTHAPSPSFDR